METLLSHLSGNAAALSIAGAAIAFLWSVVQFVLVRKRDQEHREFEIYHKLIKELVVPDSDTKVMWIDRQTAIIFELRQFRRYHELTLRTLKGLREKWTGDSEVRYPRLVEEIDLTVANIEHRKA
jgi:hypothetical protein